MALSPKDGLAGFTFRLTPEDLAEIAEREKFIDQFIQERWQGGVITMTMPEAREAIVAEVARRYEVAGWTTIYKAIESGRVKSVDGTPLASSLVNFSFNMIPRWRDG